MTTLKQRIITSFTSPPPVCDFGNDANQVVNIRGALLQVHDAKVSLVIPVMNIEQERLDHHVQLMLLVLVAVGWRHGSSQWLTTCLTQANVPLRKMRYLQAIQQNKPLPRFTRQHTTLGLTIDLLVDYVNDIWTLTIEEGTHGMETFVIK